MMLQRQHGCLSPLQSSSWWSWWWCLFLLGSSFSYVCFCNAAEITTIPKKKILHLEQLGGCFDAATKKEFKRCAVLQEQCQPGVEVFVVDDDPSSASCLSNVLPVGHCSDSKACATTSDVCPTTFVPFYQTTGTGTGTTTTTNNEYCTSAGLRNPQTNALVLPTLYGGCEDETKGSFYCALSSQHCFYPHESYRTPDEVLEVRLNPGGCTCRDVELRVCQHNTQPDEYACAALANDSADADDASLLCPESFTLLETRSSAVSCRLCREEQDFFNTVEPTPPTMIATSTVQPTIAPTPTTIITPPTTPTTSAPHQQQQQSSSIITRVGACFSNHASNVFERCAMTNQDCTTTTYVPPFQLMQQQQQQQHVCKLQDLIIGTCDGHVSKCAISKYVCHDVSTYAASPSSSTTTTTSSTLEEEGAIAAMSHYCTPEGYRNEFSILLPTLYGGCLSSQTGDIFCALSPDDCIVMEGEEWLSADRVEKLRKGGGCRCHDVRVGLCQNNDNDNDNDNDSPSYDCAASREDCTNPALFVSARDVANSASSSSSLDCRLCHKTVETISDHSPGGTFMPVSYPHRQPNMPTRAPVQGFIVDHQEEEEDGFMFAFCLVAFGFILGTLYLYFRFKGDMDHHHHHDEEVFEIVDLPSHGGIT